MKIKNLEESSFAKAGIIFNDILLLLFCYWITFALTHSFTLAFAFPYVLKIRLIIGAMTIFPTIYFFPPVFTKRTVHGNDILERTFQSVCLQTLLMMAFTELIYSFNSSYTDLFVGSVLFFILLYIERIVLFKFLKYKRIQGHNLRHVIFVGHPWNLEDIYRTFTDNSLGFKIQGIFTRKELPEDWNIPNLGDRRNVLNYLKEHPEVTDLYIVPDTDYIKETKEIFRYCENHMIRLYALPVYLEFLTKRMELSHLGNTTLLSVRKEPLQDPMNRTLKRFFDIVISGLFLLTLFPFIYLIVGIIIKIQSPGPILFRQKRNGLDGKEFYCLKFRSMHVNKDADRIQATKDDPRKFKFGNLMRKTNIDELPQFINVFKGCMTLVGPRPHMLLHTQEYSHLIQRYMVRHLVKPGITGWAQVQGFRGETKTLDQMEDRVKADIWYVENWSFSLDLLIMWRTVMNMLKHNEKNAY